LPSEERLRADDRLDDERAVAGPLADARPLDDERLRPEEPERPWEDPPCDDSDVLRVLDFPAAILSLSSCSGLRSLGKSATRVRTR
jgi:hypothetical protein